MVVVAAAAAASPGAGAGAVVVVLGFTTLLTSQVISAAFYSERENYDKFCSEALISDSGSFTCLKSTTRDPRLYFPSEVSHTQDFYALKKNPSTPTGFEPPNLGSSGEYGNHGTTTVDGQLPSLPTQKFAKGDVLWHERYGHAARIFWR